MLNLIFRIKNRDPSNFPLKYDPNRHPKAPKTQKGEWDLNPKT